jgi:chromosome segregation ATPase
MIPPKKIEPAKKVEQLAKKDEIANPNGEVADVANPVEERIKQEFQDAVNAEWKAVEAMVNERIETARKEILEKITALSDDLALLKKEKETLQTRLKTEEAVSKKATEDYQNLSMKFTEAQKQLTEANVSLTSLLADIPEFKNDILPRISSLENQLKAVLGEGMAERVKTITELLKLFGSNLTKLS